MTKYPALDEQTVEALYAYIAAEGRTWKARLRHAWMTGTLSGPLQALRNSHGPSWLVSFRVQDVL